MLLVILSEAKDLVARRARSFAGAQNDTLWPIRLSMFDELMMQYVGIDDPCGRPRKILHR
jgi:hypothetical protein